MHSHKLSLFAFSILLASTSSFAAESAMQLVDNSKISIDDIVVIALKRFQSSHTDYLKQTPITE